MVLFTSELRNKLSRVSGVEWGLGGWGGWVVGLTENKATQPSLPGALVELDKTYLHIFSED